MQTPPRLRKGVGGCWDWGGPLPLSGGPFFSFFPQGVENNFKFGQIVLLYNST